MRPLALKPLRLKNFLTFLGSFQTQDAFKRGSKQIISLIKPSAPATISGNLLMTDYSMDMIGGTGFDANPSLFVRTGNVSSSERTIFENIENSVFTPTQNSDAIDANPGSGVFLDANYQLRDGPRDAGAFERKL